MNPFTKLLNLNKNLGELSFPDLASKTHYTTSNSDTTSHLDKEKGDQIVVARPELDASSLQTGSLSTVIFVLDRDLGAGKTPEKEKEQYDRLLDKSVHIFKAIKDLTESGCNAYSGLTLSKYSVTPETSVFGGWIGWSIELTFE